MPSVVESGSVARSRVRFQEPTQASAAESLDSGSSDGGELTAAASTLTQRFELQEDPSFWKDHNVQVVIRVRPLNSSEISMQGYNRCVRQESCQTITWTGHPDSRFTFDIVADEHVSQEQLFKVAGVPMVDNCISGYNSCMFAYGQTGSGKTHTMLGDIEGGTRRQNVNCGMTPRVFEYLFSRIQKEKEVRRDDKLHFICKCSFLEIYNEQILDLLNPSSVNLQIREDARKGVHVENLTEFEVSSARDVLQQLIQGAANRKVASTNMNRASSRSHSVFTCIIESKWESQGITHHRFARLNLVDLAGSERQKSSGAEGDRLKEATNINKSLSTLGLVIMNLVSVSNKKSLHVPYRDSKLTFLLQDSLGGNSKTIIIANISPSNCCALETLSTLKFAQRAKFIRNNAIVNEDAAGDVLSMRLQIQHLKKEVNRLKGLLNAGTGNIDTDGLGASVPGSPCSFKWEGQGSFSPLISDKRLSQKKEYEAALVAAIRRDQGKEASLKAMIACKQAAEQLAAQREEKIRALQMRLRFREEGIKRLEAVASETLSAETHLLNEKEELLQEIEVLRGQLDRNPEITRFAMENLQLKEELRRLQSFVEEGEREMMNEQVTILQDKLLEALDWKLMHEKDTQNLSLSWDSSGNEENEFLLMQAIQNQREIEALRKNLSTCLEAKEKLERRVDELVLQLEEHKTHSPDKEIQIMHSSGPVTSESSTLLDNQVELKTMVDAIAVASQREAEAHETAIALTKENEELRRKLKVLIEDNNKLIELYEYAVAEGAVGPPVDSTKLEITKDQNGTSSEVKDRHECFGEFYMETKNVEDIEHQLQEMHEENEKLMGLYEGAMRERDEYKRVLVSYELEKHNSSENIICPEKLVEVDRDRGDQKQESCIVKETAIHKGVSEDVVHIVRTKMESIMHKLSAAGEVVKHFGLLEKIIAEVDELFQRAESMDHDVQLKKEEIKILKLALSQLQEKKTVFENKFVALKLAFKSFSSKAHYWLERESRARHRLETSSGLLEHKKQELGDLQARRVAANGALLKACESESVLQSKIGHLKLKLQEAECYRKENEKVLFAIDNFEKTDLSTQKAMILGKASELLKSEEERTKLSADMKLLREQLATSQKEVTNLTRKLEALDNKICSLASGVKSVLQSQQEAEVGLHQVIEEKNMLLEMTEAGKAEMDTLVVELQESVFQVDLKEEEIQLCEDLMQNELRSLEETRAIRNIALENLKEILKKNRFLIDSEIDQQECYISDQIEQDLQIAQLSLVEASLLLANADN